MDRLLTWCLVYGWLGVALAFITLAMRAVL